jgi:membrane protease YdiL (CAAX protease family)
MEIPNKMDRTRRLWIETGLVLLICVAPFLFNSWVDTHVAGYRGKSSYLLHSASAILHNAGCMALVAFVIWRSGEPLSRFGIYRFSWRKDILGGLGVWVVFRLIYRLTWFGIRLALSRESFRLINTPIYLPYELPSGGITYLLIAVTETSFGCSEELVMRGYLIPRFEELLGSTPLALLLSSVLFACYHSYQGPRGMIWAAIFGLVQGILFCLFRRLGPLAFAHSLNDFVAIGRVPIPWI